VPVVVEVGQTKAQVLRVLLKTLPMIVLAPRKAKVMKLRAERIVFSKLTLIAAGLTFLAKTCQP
tara:strand:- start:32 stop:223 length:192 start_codon:yes stop_codon:yes gene_type:complete